MTALMLEVMTLMERQSRLASRLLTNTLMQLALSMSSGYTFYRSTNRMLRIGMVLVGKITNT